MKLEEIRKTFAEKLSLLLKQKEFSASQLAEKVGIDRSNITKYISGESAPRMDVFLKICEVLETEPNYFFDMTKDDYYTSTAKSDAQKEIESIFFLFMQGVLDKNPLYRNYMEDAEYRVNDNNPILHQIMEECHSFIHSQLVESEHICRKLVEKYEMDLEKENLDQKSFMKI